MIEFISRFKIPTILGLGVIFLGLASGLYLVFKEQVFLSQASPDLTAQNITVSNLTDKQATISWQTNAATPSFITFGQNNPSEQTALDDRDINIPQPHTVHYVTLKNLLPQTNYQFKIISGKIISNVGEFDTAKPLANKSILTPIIGSVLDGNTPLNEGVAYLTINGAATQSAPVKTGGNFLISLSDLWKSDLSDPYSLTENTTAKITLISDKGSASLITKITANTNPLPPIKLGQNLDLTIVEATPKPQPSIKNLGKYDPNNDNAINAADYVIVSSCFDKPLATVLPPNIACTKADINGDKKVDQKDLDLISQKLKELGSQ